jgi:chromosome segregation ATPase
MSTREVRTERYDAARHSVSVAKADVKFERKLDELTELEHTLEQASSENKRLKHQLEQEGPTLPTNDFMALKAQIEQSEMRLETIVRKVSAERLDVESARQVEATRVAIEVARNEYNATLGEFNSTRETLLEQEQQFKNLRNAIESGAARHSDLLNKLHRKKMRLKELGINV